MSKDKILIVEDNPQNMRLIEMTLRGQGYILAKASDGQEALNIIEKENPCLIILDIQLPGMSGLEVAAELRQTPLHRCVPIIGITAYAMKGDREKVLAAGCDIYLSKPINTRELPGIVSKMLRQRQKDNTRSDGGNHDQ